MPISRFLFLIALLCSSLALADPPAETQPPKTGELLPELLEALGGTDYDAREMAQKELLSLGDASPETVIEAVYERFRATTDPEVRQRLREVLQLLVTRHLYEPGEGSLGIVARPTNRPARVGDTLYWPLKLRMVLGSSTAELGKLKIGDRIVGVDNERFGRDYREEDLASYVRLRKPGDTLTLQVLRDGAIVAFEVTIGSPAEAPDELMEQTYRQTFFNDWLRTRLLTDR